MIHVDFRLLQYSKELYWASMLVHLYIIINFPMEFVVRPIKEQVK